MAPDRSAQLRHASARLARQTALIELGGKLIGLATAAVLLLAALITAAAALLIHFSLNAPSPVAAWIGQAPGAANPLFGHICLHSAQRRFAPSSAIPFALPRGPA